MASNYPDDIQFAGLVEAATAAADAHQRDLGKRKRGEENAYIPVSTDLAFAEQQQQQPKTPTLSNSAAVLFREPSEKSKKYSRPPLGKVFTSLELAPEAFLRLQNAAKNYMLSDEFPERRDVVGHKKHNNNNDQAKLKLYQCVEDFLQQDGTGEKFFGHSANVDVPDAPPRTFFWPDDRSRIAKALMPLLRKMVTNERQRVYAAETRKQDPKKAGDKSHKERLGSERDGSHDFDENLAPEIDPSLQQDHKVDQSSVVPIAAVPEEVIGLPPDSGTITLRVNLVAKHENARKRLGPEFSLSSDQAGTYEQFLDGLKNNFDTLDGQFDMKALLPQEGLISIKSQEDWLMAQLAVAAEEWMNGQLQVVVEV
ncbi:hypothetical protein LTR70_007733 [Exophiala xenobiotica]|uniref:Uncharacterized protein n=1 Tax=Lithohypha guttulata TaxID=1690604 RepID=A0ABR0K5B2_9EURO|nr:hypothetical protein LTR24_006708 [Lithohypha guttulata]KAK5313216.1 hypothetical protein LTR70_007733 [Exophiala xenobiotica]